VLQAQALRAADLVLVVVGPDPLSYARALRTVQATAAAGAPPVALLLNGFDAARPLDRDLLAMLRAGAPGKLAPVQLHRDESLREALACKQSVLEFAPHSMAAHDVTVLTTWLLSTLARPKTAATQAEQELSLS
jgi:cellulose synthase operon protein YhjQ